MNVIVLQLQILIITCPCAKACPARSPLDELAERLRREMQFGRDSGRDPNESFNTTTKDTAFEHFSFN